MSVLASAKELLGKVKYAFGGTDIRSGGSGDCSAFTQKVFKDNGIVLGRTASQQYHSSEGEYVSGKENLAIGDLVFFTGTSTHNTVSHVGIYSGNGKFINLQSDGVMEDDLNSGYWSGHYLGAKRYSGAGGTGDGIAIGGGSSDGDTKLKVSGVVVQAVLIGLLIVVGVVFFVGAFTGDLSSLKFW